jgi:hypothetical protein
MSGAAPSRETIMCVGAFVRPVFRPGRPRAAAWRVPLLLFAAIVLVAGLAFNVANLDTGLEARPALPEPGGTAPTSGSLVDRLLLVYLTSAAFGIFFVAVVISILTGEKRKRPARKLVRRSYVLQAFIGILFLLVIIAIWRQGTPWDAEAATGNSTGSGPGFAVPDLPRIAGIPLVAFLAGSLLVAVALMAYVIRPAGFGSGFEAQGEASAARERATATVVDAIERLELGEDVRATVLRCFHRFCELLGARGVEGQFSLTPREIERLAVERLHVSGDAADELTSLFEEARYSVHELEEGHRERALRSLERIRSALGA